MSRATAIVLLGLAVLACSSEEPGSGAPRPTFEPDLAPARASITLRAAALDRHHLMLEVVAHGVDELYGAAFRLSYDPSCLRYLALERGSAFFDDALVLGREARPGLVLGVVTLVGSTPVVTERGSPAEGTAIARVSFAIDASSGSRLELVPRRSLAIDGAGHEIMLSTSGARLSF
jgi:hypothetical protein